MSQLSAQPSVETGASESGRKGEAAAWVSVGATGEAYMVVIEFTIDDPAEAYDELIAFNRVAVTSISVEEGADYDVVTIEAIDHEVEPTITRPAV